MCPQPRLLIRAHRRDLPIKAEVVDPPAAPAFCTNISGMSLPSRNDIAMNTPRSLVLRASGSPLHDTVEVPAVGDALQHVLPGILERESGTRDEVLHSP